MSKMQQDISFSSHDSAKENIHKNKQFAHLQRVKGRVFGVAGETSESPKKRKIKRIIRAKNKNTIPRDRRSAPPGAPLTMSPDTNKAGFGVQHITNRPMTKKEFKRIDDRGSEAGMRISLARDKFEKSIAGDRAIMDASNDSTRADEMREIADRRHAAADKRKARRVIRRNAKKNTVKVPTVER